MNNSALLLIISFSCLSASLGILFVAIAVYQHSKSLSKPEGKESNEQRDIDPIEPDLLVTENAISIEIETPGQEVIKPHIEITKQEPESQITITSEFETAFRLFSDPLPFLFITGKAGTGKSTLLQELIHRSKKRIAVLAPTGIASINIRGQTIHSFFKFPPRYIDPEEIVRIIDRELYKNLDGIIIDEISMVRADMMDAIDTFLRLNGKNQMLPFGGIPIIAFGDLFQLPPIVADKEEKDFFYSMYKSPFFFSANVFNNMRIECIELTKVFRQKDLGFINILDEIRMDRVSRRNLNKINTRCFKGRSYSNPKGIITLTPTNRRANQINAAKLRRLPAEEHLLRGEIEGEFPPKSYPTLLELRVKVGAQIMFVKNDLDRRWVNGTIGKITEIAEHYILIEVKDKDTSRKSSYKVGKDTWEILRYKFNRKKGKLTSEVIGLFIQFPVKLAWAVTIHKSQGLTFDEVLIDFDRGTFASGQAYVALSRSTSLEGISLTKELRRKDIIVDPYVLDFHSKVITHKGYSAGKWSEAPKGKRLFSRW